MNTRSINIHNPVCYAKPGEPDFQGKLRACKQT
jgi:hypothetical protein